MADWQSLWTNANVATMGVNGKPYGLIKDAAIGISNKKVSWLGPMLDLPASPSVLADNVIDCDGGWITPGLIDCHTHLVFGGNRVREFELRLEGASYEEISRQGGGIRSTVTATREASEELLYHNGLERLNRLMMEGVTTVEIKSGYGLNTETEIKMLRIALRLGKELPLRVKTTFLGAHALPVEFNDNSSGYINLVCDEMMPAVAKDDLADAVDIFCEGIGFDINETRKVFEKATDLNLPIKIHAEQLSNLGGTALACEYGALSADHLEYLDEAGIDAMAESGTVAVLLPGAYYFLRETQLPPILGFRDKKVPIAIATDLNPGSSPAQSLLKMHNMATTLFQLPPEEALAGVTTNAARALGLQEETGHLAIGMAADFVLWDITEPAELSYWIGNTKPKVTVFAGSVRS